MLKKEQRQMHRLELENDELKKRISIMQDADHRLIIENAQLTVKLKLILEALNLGDEL